MHPNLFIETEHYYLFLDESGTPEMNDLAEEFFVLSCIKVEKHYYDNIFRKNILRFKKKHKIANLVLHSADIRKHRKGFEFLKGSKNAETRNSFFKEISALIDGLDFEIFYFSINKKQVEDDFDLYWHALREILLMIKNNLATTNSIINIFCEARNKDQNNKLANAYNAYLKKLSVNHKFKICFPAKLDFRQKDATLYEISGIEIADLVAFPIMNFIRNKNSKTQINPNLLENYKILKSKIVKNYHYNLHKNNPYKKPPMGADKLT